MFFNGSLQILDLLLFICNSLAQFLVLLYQITLFGLQCHHSYFEPCLLGWLRPINLSDLLELVFFP